jgi:hypothetical protein
MIVWDLSCASGWAWEAEADADANGDGDEVGREETSAEARISDDGSDVKRYWTVGW